MSDIPREQKPSKQEVARNLSDYLSMKPNISEPFKMFTQHAIDYLNED